MKNFVATNANQDPVLKPRLHEQFFLNIVTSPVVAKRVTKFVILSRKVQLVEFLATFFSDIMAVAVPALARGWLHG